MTYVNPLDIVELMSDNEYEAFKDTLINAHAIDPRTQTVKTSDLYTALHKSGVGDKLLDRYIQITTVDSNVPVTNIEDLPNLIINNKAYLLKLKEPLTLKRGGSLKLEVFTALIVQRLTCLGYTPTLTKPHVLETKTQISKLIKYLTTHYLTKPLAVSIHTRNKSMSVYFNNGHRLVPLDDDVDGNKVYKFTLGNIVQSTMLITVLIDSITEDHAFPTNGTFINTVDDIKDSLDDYGIKHVTLMEQKQS